MSVTVRIDPHGTDNAGDAFHVETEREYMEARTRIEEAVRSKTSLTVSVHNPAMRTWFDSLRERKEVHFEICDPTKLLARYLKVNTNDIPRPLQEDPQAIVDAGLMRKAKDIPLRHGQSVLSWIMEQTLGPLWAKEELREPGQVAELIAQCVTQDENRVQNPTVLSLRNSVVGLWSQNRAFGPLIKWLFDGDSFKRAETLVLYARVRTYPQNVKARALAAGDRWEELASLEHLDAILANLDLSPALSVSVPRAYANAVRKHLRDQIASKGFEAALACISGCLPEEEEVFEEYLRNHIQEIDETWCARLDEALSVFARKDKPSELVNLIRRIYPAKRPSELPEDASWEATRSWLEGEYFPFYSYSLNTQRLKETRQSVDSFEKWLLASYDASTRTAAYQPFALRKEVADLVDKGPVLLLVMDAMSWFDCHEFCRCLAARGFQEIELSTRLATVPTITPVAKPSLLRGQLPGQLYETEQSSAFYAQLLAEAMSLKSDDIAYATFAEAPLKDVTRTRKRLYLFLDNEIDTLVHRHLSSGQRSCMIHDHLRNLAQDMAEARREYLERYGQELALVVVSDHGYTELPGESCDRLVYIEADDIRILESRVVWCSTPESDAESPGFWSVGSDLLKGTTHVFHIAKGYSFINARPRGAVHGGLTPQEAVVAMMVFDPSETVVFHELQFSVAGEICRGRSSNDVLLAVTNPNTQPVQIADLQLRLTKFEQAVRIAIPPGETFEMHCTVDASNIKTAEIQLSGTATLTFRGHARSCTMDLKTKTTGAALGDLSFDDGFDV